LCCLFWWFFQWRFWDGWPKKLKFSYGHMITQYIVYRHPSTWSNMSTITYLLWWKNSSFYLIQPDPMPKIKKKTSFFL
jgi:hypothetical protein